MKSLLVAAVIFSSAISFATGTKGYDLEMKLSIDGKNVASPRLIVKEGQKGTVVQESNGVKSVIEVVAKEVKTEDGSKAIKMAFVVSNMNSDGTSKVISQPQILARPNTEALIEVGQSGNPKLLSLKVVAKNIIF
jgi:type II secretory pathway component GspD/PulD (secretin)